MSFENPTAVKIGMTGTFSGITYRVQGRVVMGVVDNGATYYWNEFNLQAESGECTTLVYEVTQSGGEWRLFTMFEPQFPITAADASTKRVGDPINLDGTDVHVTLLDRSQVFYIEGKAPEDVEVGDAARYFNAELGWNMIVVSWTGEEVECYHGKTIAAMLVAKAFNIPARNLSSLTPDLSNFTLSGASSPQRSLLPFAAGILLIILFVGLALRPTFSRPRAPAVTRIAAPTAQLPVGSSGNIEGKTYTVVSDALVEVNEVGVVFQRHEFHLRDQDGNGALIIRGWRPGAKDWCLFALREPADTMTPQHAGAIQIGQSIPFGGTSVTVNTLSRSITLKVNTADILQAATGRVYYGFSGGAGITLMLARWDAESIHFYEGHTLHADPSSAFTPPVEK